MKNYKKPEVISPTLEADELGRLYESIKNVVSIEDAEAVIKEIPLANIYLQKCFLARVPC